MDKAIDKTSKLDVPGNDSLYNLNAEHEQNFLGGFDSTLFESEGNIKEVAPLEAARESIFDIKKIARDVNELETHLHERHETVLTELDVSCIRAELDRLNHTLQKEGKRRKMTNVDAAPIMELYKKTSSLAKTGADAANELRQNKAGGGLPPLISEGDLAESDDSDEEAEIPDELSSPTALANGANLPDKDSSAKPALCRFTSEFLGEEYQVGDMGKEVTYELSVATESNSESSVDGDLREKGLKDEESLVQYLHTLKTVPAEMEVHLEPNVSIRKKPFDARDLAPVHIEKVSDMSESASSRAKDPLSPSLPQCDDQPSLDALPKVSDLSTASASVSVSTVATHWEASDITDHMLTPSVQSGASHSTWSPIHQPGIPFDPPSSNEMAITPLDTDAVPPKQHASVVATKHVLNAYEAAAARAKQRKKEEDEREEQLLLNKEVVSVPIQRSPPKVETRKQAHSVGDHGDRVRINWGGFLSPKAPEADKKPAEASSAPPAESGKKRLSINWGGFLSPKSQTKEIFFPKVNLKKDAVDASEGFRPAVQVKQVSNKNNSPAIIFKDSVIRESVKKMMKPKTKPKPKPKKPAEGGMVMLEREKKSRKQQVAAGAVEASAPPVSSAPPAEIAANLEAVGEMMEAVKSKRLSKQDIKKLIGIQSEEEITPPPNLKKELVGEMSESEFMNVSRERKNAISPPAEANEGDIESAKPAQIAEPAQIAVQPHDPNNIPDHFMRLSEITSLPFDQLFEYYVSTGLPLVAFTKEDVLAEICKYNKVRPELEEEELEIPAFVNLVPNSTMSPALTQPVQKQTNAPVQIQKKPKQILPPKDGLYPMRALMEENAEGGEQVLQKSDSELARELAMELNELDQLDAEWGSEALKRGPEGGEGAHATARKLEQAKSFSNGEFRQGEKVRTKVISKKGEVWIEAEIFDYNDEDDTWNVRVCEPEKHRVTPMAVHVPRKFIEKIVKDDHMAQLIAMGYEQKVAYQTLEAAHGNLEFALSLLVDNRANIPEQLRPSKVSHIRFGELPPIKGKKGGAPNKDEFDYEVSFTEKRYGFEIIQGQDGRNGIVGTRVSDFSKVNVHQGSLIVSVQGEFCVGLRLKKIRKLMIKASAKPPVVIRFRAKRWMRETSKKHGTLKILVVGAQALYKGATHVTIRVHEALLTTDRVKKDENPFWNEMMMWKQYHPKRSQHAILKVWSYNRFTSNSCIGKAKVRLPHKFEKLEEQLVQIQNNSGNTVGLVMLRSVVSRNPYRIFRF